MTIGVVIADDHALVREGIRAVINRTTTGIHVLAEASHGQEVLDISRKMKVDIFLLDISMPRLNGIEVAQRLVKSDASSKVIMLSMHDDMATVQKALDSGARGYLVKESVSEDVVRAIREVFAGRLFLSKSVARFIVDDFGGGSRQYSKASRFITLTAKEKEVLHLVAEGLSSKDIGRQLDIASATVLVHRKNIMRKLDIHNQADLVRFALKEAHIR